MKLKFIFHGLLLFLGMSSFGAVTPTFEIEKSPEWKTKIPYEIHDKDFRTSGDMSYILLDFQKNELLHESNYRYVLRLNNEAGVENYSQITINFDPSYQKLSVNKIAIHRGNQVINHLKRSEIELMRNEKSTDRLIYDGSYLASIILKDVRIGDVLEYEYTIKGENPIFSGYTYEYVCQSFSAEVIRNYQRIIVPVSVALNTKTIQGGQQPIVSVNGNTKSLVWDIANRPAIYEDANIPTWYDAYPACEISSFKDWGEVIKWGMNLYPFDMATPGIDFFMHERKFDKSEKGILGVIRFVQDEVRYLGIEIGSHSHQPHHPEETLKNRFGDCKDKSYLLADMLRKLGVEAWPAYAHTTNRGHIDENAPSPFAFNHVIVKFRWDGVNYWVDPTINQQHGDLALLCLPNYQKALVLDEKSKATEEIPVSKLDRVVIDENIWFTDSTSDVRYEVESVYYGNLANSKRAAHLSASISETRENYINYCSGYYSNLKWANDSALHYIDYPENNSFIVHESYIISDFWSHRSTDSTEFYASVYPYNLYEYLSSSKDKSRKMPLAMHYPVDVEETIVMHFPVYKQFGFKPALDSVVNKAYSFYHKSSVNPKLHTYTLNYRYITKTDNVPVDQLKAYFTDYGRLSDLCDDSIKWGTETISVMKIFWPSVIVSLLFVCLLIWILRFMYWSDLGIVSSRKKPQDLGGWLILPVIGLYVTPLVVFSQFYKTNYFSQGLWNNFMEKVSSHPYMMGGFFYFELLFNISIIVFSVFMIVLQVEKRITFPKIYIWFRIIVLGGVLLDTLLSFTIFDVKIDSSELTREIIGVGIWVPYFMMSERVANTFVNVFRKSGTDAEAAIVTE